MVAAVAEPQGSWPCRKLGPGAWPPIKKSLDGYLPGTLGGLKEPLCPLPTVHTYLGPDLEGRPQLQPHSRQQVLLGQQGQGLPINPLFSEHLEQGQGQAHQSCPAKAQRAAMENKQAV